VWPWLFLILAIISFIALLYFIFVGQGQIQYLGLSSVTGYVISGIGLVFNGWKLFSTPILSYGDFDIKEATYRTGNVLSVNKVYLLIIKKTGFGSANACEGLLTVGKHIEHYTVWHGDERRILITINGRLKLFEISEHGDMIFRSSSEKEKKDVPVKYDVLRDEILYLKIGSENAFTPIRRFQKPLRDILDTGI
jgi:hypothetical protein